MRMSRPETISGLSVLASFNASKHSAGRKFAKSSRSLRRRSKPRSGFCAKGSLSHLGPPTAPNNTASAFLALAIVSSGSGVPSVSKAMPPIWAVSVWKAKLRFLEYQPSTRCVCSITSGPMPSPGVRRILCVMSEPGLRGGAFGFEAGNVAFVAQGETDIVPAVHQTLLAEGIDFELHDAAIRPADFLIFQIDGDERIGAAFRVVHQLVDDLLRQRDGQDAVLEAVVVENIREAGREDHAKAEIQQPPRRVFAARATAEIRPGDQNFGALIGWLVQY